LLYANEGFPKKADIIALLTAYIDSLEKMIARLQNQPQLEITQP
jgi:hypothetical protein